MSSPIYGLSDSDRAKVVDTIGRVGAIIRAEGDQVTRGVPKFVGFFPVRVTLDGGGPGGSSPGNPPLDCTFTYTVRALDNATILLTTATPLKKRWALTKYRTPAGTEFGSAFIDQTGTLKLWDANEVEDAAPCGAPAPPAPPVPPVDPGLGDGAVVVPAESPGFFARLFGGFG